MLEILLVDEEASFLEVVGNSLRSQGHTVAIAPDGAKALEEVGRKKFDVVVGGPDVLEKLKASSPDTKVILISNEGGGEQSSAGALGSLKKPFEPQELTRLLEKVGKKEEGLRPLHDALGEFEKNYLQKALAYTGGKKAAAARLLGISRKNLWEKLKRYTVGDEKSSDDSDHVDHGSGPDMHPA